MVLTEVVDLRRNPLDRLRSDWLVSTKSVAKSTKGRDDLLLSGSVSSRVLRAERVGNHFEAHFMKGLLMRLP